MVNLLTDPGMVQPGTNWVTSQGSFSVVPGRTGNGIRFTTGGTGNRNFQSFPNSACTPGEVFSAGVYAKWALGTPKAISVMCRFLNDSAVQMGNVIGSLVTPGTGDWSLIKIENALAPAGTTQVQLQVRINAASTTTEAADFDDAMLNRGATLESAPVTPTGPTFKVWNGTNEVNATMSVWNGTQEVSISTLALN